MSVSMQDIARPFSFTTAINYKQSVHQFYIWWYYANTNVIWHPIAYSKFPCPTIGYNCPTKCLIRVVRSFMLFSLIHVNCGPTFILLLFHKKVCDLMSIYFRRHPLCLQQSKSMSVSMCKIHRSIAFTWCNICMQKNGLWVKRSLLYIVWHDFCISDVQVCTSKCVKPTLQ